MDENRNAKFKSTVQFCLAEPVAKFLAAHRASVLTLMQFGYAEEDAKALVDECIEEMYQMVRKEK